MESSLHRDDVKMSWFGLFQVPMDPHHTLGLPREINL